MKRLMTVGVLLLTMGTGILVAPLAANAQRNGRPPSTNDHHGRPPGTTEHNRRRTTSSRYYYTYTYRYYYYRTRWYRGDVMIINGRRYYHYRNSFYRGVHYYHYRARVRVRVRTYGYPPNNYQYNHRRH